MMHIGAYLLDLAIVLEAKVNFLEMGRPYGETCDYISDPRWE